MSGIKIGVLSIQGNVYEHIVHMKNILDVRHISGNVFGVKLLDDMENLDGLIIPGGESTTMSKLMRKFDVYDRIIELHDKEIPILGTCAGSIMLSKEIIDAGEHDVKTLGLMDMKVSRNSYGRQRESFESVIDVKDGADTKSIPGIFIRAPGIVELWGNAKAAGWLGADIVMAVQDNTIATTFHPELSDDTTVHEMFLDIAMKRKKMH